MNKPYLLIFQCMQLCIYLVSSSPRVCIQRAPVPHLISRVLIHGIELRVFIYIYYNMKGDAWIFRKKNESLVYVGRCICVWNVWFLIKYFALIHTSIIKNEVFLLNWHCQVIYKISITFYTIVITVVFWGSLNRVERSFAISGRSLAQSAIFGNPKAMM